MADLERTFVMIKPDAHARRLTGEILARFERRGFTIRALRLLRVTPDLAGQHYAEHEGKPFYPGLVEFITSAPVVAMVLEGPAAVATVRTMMGTTNPLESAPGTIRGDYALELGENVIHGSDSVASAEREIAIYFTADDLAG
ncbi:MAG: nucleoside-diphosphate kinase [Gaiellales bacterium]|jgi:nucleoside-diphosphate kinase|nr:nucleoside-diphosphate kinase [Gaiellales bacterium]MDX6551421.1 nucleoside-diphosphate kinase [Gaiellales bacterium]